MTETKTNEISEDDISYAASDELWTWYCDEVLSNPIAEFTERDRELMSTGTRDENPKHICLPPGVKRLCRTLQKENNLNFLSEVIRRCLLQGHSIHTHKHGARLHELCNHPIISDAVWNNNGRVMKETKEVKGVCEFPADRCTTAKFNEEFWELLEESREEAGIGDREKWITYLIVLALESHTALKAWEPVFTAITNMISEHLENRIATLKRITGGS